MDQNSTDKIGDEGHKENDKKHNHVTNQTFKETEHNKQADVPDNHPRQTKSILKFRIPLDIIISNSDPVSEGRFSEDLPEPADFDDGPPSSPPEEYYSWNPSSENHDHEERQSCRCGCGPELARLRLELELLRVSMSLRIRKLESLSEDSAEIAPNQLLITDFFCQPDEKRVTWGQVRKRSPSMDLEERESYFSALPAYWPRSAIQEVDSSATPNGGNPSSVLEVEDYNEDKEEFDEKFADQRAECSDFDFDKSTDKNPQNASNHHFESIIDSSIHSPVIPADSSPPTKLAIPANSRQPSPNSQEAVQENAVEHAEPDEALVPPQYFSISRKRSLSQQEEMEVQPIKISRL
ncbi:hypothetical protein EDC01DRAFT_632286 [Geopyxis carbonaria]|nr:hypothetical protein EDC01DRAFT_632286 [Geopyxis carbonaria]